MAGLIEPEVGASGEWDAGGDAPFGFAQFGVADSLRVQTGQCVGKVVAQEVERSGGELVAGVGLGEVLVGGVNAHFGGGQLEDEPSAAAIDVGEAQTSRKKARSASGLWL